jgi:lipid-A-disaccharide synthase-like uncharacterized protein
MSRDERGGSPRISVVVPVYNEEENLPVLLREIRETLDPLGQSYEVVFVDDGSRDRSLEVLKGLLPENPMVRVVVFEKNAGQTAAMDAGLRAARGEILVTLDADLQNDPHDIPLLLAEIGRFDVVVGYRAIRQDSLVKRITSKVGNGVRNWLTRERIRDTGCSLKAFRGGAAQTLQGDAPLPAHPLQDGGLHRHRGEGQPPASGPREDQVRRLRPPPGHRPGRAGGEVDAEPGPGVPGKGGASVSWFTWPRFWLVLGFVAQGAFFMRFVVQWIASERKKRSVVPVAFWYFSVVGGVLLLAYSIYRKDPVFIVGQATGLFIYARNLMLIYRRRGRGIPVSAGE